MYLIEFHHDQSLSAAEEAKLKQALIDLQEVMSFRIRIPGDDKAKMNLLGPSNLSFVEKCLGYAKTNPEYLSRELTTDDFNRYMRTREVIRAFLGEFVPLVQTLKDTMDYLGHLSMGHSLSYYTGVKEGLAWNRLPAKSIHDDLSKRFAAQGTTKPKSDEDKEEPVVEAAESDEVITQAMLTRLANELQREQEAVDAKNEEDKAEGGGNEE